MSRRKRTFIEDIIYKSLIRNGSYCYSTGELRFLIALAQGAKHRDSTLMPAAAKDHAYKFARNPEKTIHGSAPQLLKSNKPPYELTERGIQATRVVAEVLRRCSDIDPNDITSNLEYDSLILGPEILAQ